MSPQHCDNIAWMLGAYFGGQATLPQFCMDVAELFNSQYSHNIATALSKIKNFISFFENEIQLQNMC